MNCAASVNQKISKEANTSLNQTKPEYTSDLVKQKCSKYIRCLGYFHCWRCNNSWQSEHVFFHPENQQEKYRQKCKRCHTFYKPFSTEAVKCMQCHSMEGGCHCVEPDYPEPTQKHRRDLCERCLTSSGWCDQGEDGTNDEDLYDPEYADNVDDWTSEDDVYNYEDSFGGWTNNDDLYDDDD